MDLITTFIMTHSDGRTNPICGSRLASVFGVDGTKIRRLVNAARCNGDPICSNGNGYYIASGKEELQRTIDSLDGRIAVMTNARDGLKRRLEEM